MGLVFTEPDEELCLAIRACLIREFRRRGILDLPTAVITFRDSCYATQSMVTDAWSHYVSGGGLEG